MKEQYTLEEDGFRGIWLGGDKYRDKAIVYEKASPCTGSRVIR